MYVYPYEPTTTRLVKIIVSIESGLALIINLFLVFILFRLRYRCNSYGFQLISLIAICDILVSATIISLVTSHSFLGYEAAAKSSWYCPIHGFFLLFSHVLSGVLVCFLAIDRYTVVCHLRRIDSSIMWWTLFTIVFVYGGVLMINAVSNTFVLEPTYCFCMPYGPIYSFVARILVDTLFCLPLLILTFCYVSILLKCYQNSLVNREFFSCRLPVRALLFLAFYFICYFPKCFGSLWLIIASENSVPLVLYVLMSIGLTLVTAINPIMVLLLNHQVSKEVSMIFGIPVRRCDNSLIIVP